jgi:hypothetical protein
MKMMRTTIQLKRLTEMSGANQTRPQGLLSHPWFLQREELQVRMTVILLLLLPRDENDNKCR